MIEYESKTITQSIKSAVVIICNKCGKESEVTDENQFDVFDQYHHIEVNFGYGSNYDGEQWWFDLCENCLLEIENSFKIPVEKRLPWHE